MIIFIIYIIILSVYELQIILENKKKDRFKTILIYFSICITCIITGLYYYKAGYNSSIVSYILKIFNLEYK